ncbi:unnamed protein product [Mytilus edulis]|uniref:Ig-like domain-containing protein n=1 Tax=Mytilus edulis TaxID=6550 RepID=A0A8S3QJX8_MYTED|nr:unnamed protein product [Mytilus edulis]
MKYGPSTVTISPSLLSYNVTETSGSIPAITCKADDCKPDCKVTWSGPNIDVATESVLNLQSINRNQAGLYICNASNVAWVKRLPPLTLLLNVNGPNDVNIYPSNLEYNVPQTTGNIGPINCTADCYPKCRMSWNGPNIPSDITSVLSLYGIGRNQTEATSVQLQILLVVMFQQQSSLLFNVSILLEDKTYNYFYVASVKVKLSIPIFNKTMLCDNQ